MREVAVEHCTKKSANRQQGPFRLLQKRICAFLRSQCEKNEFGMDFRRQPLYVRLNIVFDPMLYLHQV